MNEFTNKVLKFACLLPCAYHICLCCSITRIGAIHASGAIRFSKAMSKPFAPSVDLYSPAPQHLPTLLEYETLYSWCGRVHKLNGNILATDTSYQLFGAPYAALAHDFPSYLENLTAQTNACLGTSTELALRHTLLGYYLPFLSPDHANTVLDDVRHGSSANLKFKLGLPASRVGAYHPLKFCTECQREDIASLGTAVWHLEHQFPSNAICRMHRMPLMYVHDRISPVHRREWHFPESGPERALIVVHIDQPHLIDILFRLAQFSDAVASCQPASLDPLQLAWAYQTALRDRGLATPSGNLRIGTLIPKFQEHYSGLERVPGFNALRSIQHEWPGFVGNLERRRPRPGHPLKHILLMAFLFDDWACFREVYDHAVSDPPAWTRPAEPSGPPQVDPQTEAFVHLVRHQALSITAAAKAVGVTATTGVKWAKLNGLPYRSRTKTLFPEILDCARQLLAEGLPKKEVASRAGVTMVSLNRLLASEPETLARWKSSTLRIEAQHYRHQFLQCLAEHPGWPVRRVRSLPGNGYQWLYKNDREWLLEHLPSFSNAIKE